MRAEGESSHAKYGTWLLIDDTDQPFVSHIDGSSFLTQEQERQRDETMVRNVRSEKNGTDERELDFDLFN